MARKPETVRVVPIPGLRFPPEDVTPQEAAAMVATGSYVIEGEPSDIPAVMADTTEATNDAG